MYRQILLHPDDRNFQRIFWRADINQPIQEFVLNTVSYGTAPAAFLATSTLNHLADIDCQPDSPVSITIKNGFYVDDLISGCSSLEEAIPLVQQLIATLQGGGFELRKFIVKNFIISQLVRIAAYILRFIHNLKHCREPASQQSVELSVQEIQAAELRIIQDIQSDVFADDLKSLRQGKELPSNSSIKSLSPFIHTDNLLRVGGRLREADIPFDYKHQILLPAKHRFTRALIVSFHRRLQHAGVQVTMASIRQRFWIPSTRRIIKSVLKGCKMCFRCSTFRSEQIMGHLPAVRVQPDFPFYNCGVDYAGPLSIRLGGSKSRNFSKAYLALFICMVTRAVHVEVVSELSTKAFIAALIRFSARRGIPFAIHSDNATTFVGAHNELNELHAFLSDSAIQSEIHNFAAVFNIGWHFIPPRAPHFGGLWENADPQDLAYLSPGHFLVGRPLTALPFHTPTTTHIDHRSRWRQLALITQELWDCWSAEFLVTLQRKSKWSSESENLQIGAVVILKDTGTSPSVWKLARITAVHPGKDNKVRVVTVRTASGTFKRAISSIAPLPLDEEFSD
ncbi:uncharacterized protein LOC120353913 [Nilaparvata lugens]|uniref:uncharacterized protein LOC120353913 n=1 Tax=Nilaparvata lugens TaxID=108931 RepID=UPI00193E81A0|nr:uncharacterized protein LOC120353913 [Nilaparvata lugens]